MGKQTFNLFKEFQKKLEPVLLPKRLLRPNTRPTKEHVRQVLAENEIERKWYKDALRFKVFEEIIDSVEAGDLVRVEGTSNYLPILRLRNRDLEEFYPPYLTTKAKALLDEVGSRWRKAVQKASIDNNLRLSVTSLVRSLAYQYEIVKAGKLADPESVHTCGEAFDIDASGYYVGEMAVNARSNSQSDFAKAFRQMGADQKGPKFINYDKYNPQVHQILKRILVEMQRAAKLHFVHENPGTTNSVFHVCRNPAYVPLQ